jgi:hypothetical protein
MSMKYEKYSPEFREEAAKMVVEDQDLLLRWPES